MSRTLDRFERVMQIDEDTLQQYHSNEINAARSGQDDVELSNGDCNLGGDYDDGNYTDDYYYPGSDDEDGDSDGESHLADVLYTDGTHGTSNGVTSPATPSIFSVPGAEALLHRRPQKGGERSALMIDQESGHSE